MTALRTLSLLCLSVALGACSQIDTGNVGVERTLGKELRDEFITYKTQEWEAYHLSVSQWEIERYSHQF